MLQEFSKGKKKNHNRPPSHPEDHCSEETADLSCQSSLCFHWVSCSGPGGVLVRRITGWESMRQTWLLQPHNRIRQSPHQNILSQLSCHITLVQGGSITLALPLFSVMSCLQSRETPADKDYTIISDLWPRGVEGLLYIRECLRMRFLLTQSVMMISSNRSPLISNRVLLCFFYFCGGGVFFFLKFADYQCVEDVTNIDSVFLNSWHLAQGCIDWIKRRSDDLWFNELKMLNFQKT